VYSYQEKIKGNDMKAYNIVLALLICLSPAVAHAEKLVLKTPAQTSKAVELLVTGIRESKPAYVKYALDMGIDLNIRIGQYADTPLMHAIRVYCAWLANQVQFNGKSFIKRLLFSEIAGFTAGMATFVLLSKWGPQPTATNPNPYGFLGKAGLSWVAASSTSFFVWLLMTIPLTSSAPGKVVDLLIRAEPNINARNKEGLDARDILRSYFPIAYQLKDEDWFRFLYIIMHRAGVPTTPQDVMEDISEQYNEFINQQP
jgi:hypothetical protein